ncbi:MAG: hypothetical protein LBQ24_07560 [Candidatus Peribacteria bacterium]|nr:hypothetical protein [Candidatus Peribacteria bacterium]
MIAYKIKALNIMETKILTIFYNFKEIIILSRTVRFLLLSSAKKFDSISLKFFQCSLSIFKSTLLTHTSFVKSLKNTICSQI